MNVVLDDASEIYVKTGKPRRSLGEFRIVFVFDNGLVFASAGSLASVSLGTEVQGKYRMSEKAVMDRGLWAICSHCAIP